MIAYTMLGTNNFERASEFYDALLAEIGGRRGLELEGVILYAGAEGTPFFGLGKPHDGNAASVGNGVMIALAADGPEAVQRLHARALELGASDEGAPGPRSRSGFDFYAGYFRDLDGNKLNFFCM
ncbi:VOC family protein [Pararhodobacter sp. SW119]|uniref:VOC family protein n=1 Tax=Pararhodobacter sp. SW119 TaxID=2780075 RepID=UPI001AE097ED|nr:VOC family protein [Pararhodobacter sp. SW119]